MNTRERFVRVLTGQEVDRVPFIKVFGGDNAVLQRWEREHPGIGQNIDKLLQFEGTYRGWAIVPANFWLSNRGKPEIEERDGDVLYKWCDGTVQLSRKGEEDYHGHLMEWPVKDRNDWDRVKERHLNPHDPERIPEKWDHLVDEYRDREYPLQLTHGGVYGFCRNLMGDEALSYAFYDDPGLVHDMMNTYTDMLLVLWEKLAQNVDYDLIEFWEDMASKNGCLISPATYREFLKPNYLKVKDFAEAHGIKIILVDSDGFVEDMVPLMLECGITTTYPMEVQSCNDSGKMLDMYPSLGIIGGLNKEVMAWSKSAIDEEIEKGRQLIKKGRFIPGPDHFVLSNVSYENYEYFFNRLREVVMTTKPGD